MPVKFLAAFCFYVLCHLAVTAQVIVTVAGIGVDGYSGDGGPATNAKMSAPSSLVFDKNGNFYFTEDGNATIRKVAPSGLISRFAGNRTSGYSGDGGPAVAALIGGGAGLAVDKWNNIYLADGDNHRIRKITTDGVIRTIAGTGVAGYNGDGISALSAQLNYPHGIGVDDTGNVYICDRMNFRLRKVDTFGNISTIAGTGVMGFTADGARADTAAINESWYVVADKNGDIYFMDKARIRKIAATDHKLSTVAGNGINAYSGDGGPATAASIGTQYFTFDSVGNMFLAEGGVCRIRKVTTDGNISTIVGNGLVGIDPEGVSLSVARVLSPTGIAFSQIGELYFTEKSGAKVRKITLAWDGVNEVNRKSIGLEVFPNPTHGRVSVRINAIEREANLTMIDARGVAVMTMTVPCNVTKEIDVNGLRPGVYTVKMIVGSDEVSQQLIVK
ncbi:MAG: T9SS type A sorting domain-containing protein [Chitinophagaceae bacterium]|nr:T9SS type A sorting domain-containing protein [Chitinophagaceae bacterium]